MASGNSVSIVEMRRVFSSEDEEDEEDEDAAAADTAAPPAAATTPVAAPPHTRTEPGRCHFRTKRRARVSRRSVAPLGMPPD